MSAQFDQVSVGDELPTTDITVTRADLIRYAGASGDFNVIHWNERVATSVGLPGVIAHGMYTMALGGRYVSEWVGDAGAVLEYGVRFTNPVPVPDDETGATLTFGGKVTKTDQEARTATVTLTALSGEQKVLGKAIAVVRLP
ncbi:MaoC/PaaZ C-terminal domain-containing protein [Kineosporia babensis]|uniref:MaoC family dehydratase N-terminal domain-containing protein n=1 Tax=Kineosporia babensis TaxID=499548 RepID=A0A9X1NGC7_9ACTN|nr:MaoC family dehydratase N-terminal domain-containing protein [Kineosporia babensis]